METEINDKSTGELEDVEGFSLEQKQVDRPVFLKVLCVLTFIGSGSVLLASILTILFSGVMEGIIVGMGLGMEDYYAGQNLMFSSFITLVLGAASLYGAIRMWRLERFGFWVYAMVQFVTIFLMFSVLGVLINAAFVLMYYKNYKYMVK